jgi:hypothetical protein
MRPIFVLLLVFLLQAAEPPRHQLDLEPLLNDPVALQKSRIMYQLPSHKVYQAFFVYGDGRVVWQAYSKRPMSSTEVPTCRNKIVPDKVKHLVQLIIEKHFFDLPEKHFIYVYASQNSEEDLEVHSIAIDDGVGKVFREFGTGEYAGKEESIPPNFSSIEQELKSLKDTAFPLSAMNCHLAPAINFWK